MQLTSHQARRLYLAGTVSFPTPFPSLGTVSFETFDIHFPPDNQCRQLPFLVVQEPAQTDCALTRAVAAEEVQAVFFAGVEDTTVNPSVFRFADPSEPVDLEKGKWFLRPDIDVNQIAPSLHLQVRTLEDRFSPAKGIVFVSESARVFSNLETFQTAGEASDWMPRSLACCTCGYMIKCCTCG